MNQTWEMLAALFYYLKGRAHDVGLEDGTVAEKVVLTAIFVALAIVAGTIIYNAVKTKATQISYNTPNG